MSTQLLIYETAVAISSTRHRDSSVESGGYGFSRNVNAVPLLAVEFPFASAEYPIVFTGNDDTLMPAVILGLRGQENAYLDTEGSWNAKYIPAFIRRYPFVFSSTDDGKTLTLCIDEAFAGFNREGRGQALYGEDGKPTDYVQNVLKFLQDYQAQFQRTRAFCARLRELDLLEPMQASVSLESGEQLSMSGFMAVDRKRLKALPGEKLAELAQNDELELLYIHLQSMRNFTEVKERLAGAKDGDGETEGGNAEEADAEEADA